MTETLCNRVIQRFFDKVAYEPTTGCWLWTGGLTERTHGYGLFRFQSKSCRAHRISWLIHKGAIPAGLWVLHKCDTRPCVNPEHLFLGNGADNFKDMVTKGRGRWLHGADHPTAKNPKLSPFFGKVGEKHYRAKLTDNLVRLIRELRSKGLSYPKISKLTGVSKSNVGCVCRRKTWVHV